MRPYMKFHFCENDRNEITLALSFILGYFMLAVKESMRHQI